MPGVAVVANLVPLVGALTFGWDVPSVSVLPSPRYDRTVPLFVRPREPRELSVAPPPGRFDTSRETQQRHVTPPAAV